MSEARIEIHEGFLAGDNTNILPVRKSKTRESYDKKSEEQISICCYYLEGYLETLLNQYYSNEVQLEDYKNTAGYDEFGWNFYTPEQIGYILADLEKYIVFQNASDRITDFYNRFIIRMKQMLNNMDGYDLILFCGP